MRAEMAMSRVAEGVHPVSERTWKALFGVHGTCPPHNTFVHMATLRKEVSRTQARDDFQTLKNLYNGYIPQEEERVSPSTIRETPVPVRAEAADVTTLREEMQALREQEQALREDVLPRLAKLEAQQASLWGAVQGLEDQLRLVVVQVQGHDAVVMTVQELLTLLSANDDAFDSLERLIRPVSTHSQRTLQRFLWGKIGRKLHTNDFIPAQ